MFRHMAICCPNEVHPRKIQLSGRQTMKMTSRELEDIGGAEDRTCDKKRGRTPDTSAHNQEILDPRGRDPAINMVDPTVWGKPVPSALKHQ